MKTGSDNKKIAINTLYMSVRMVFVLVITLYSSRVLLKTLGVEDYGIYNVVAGFVTLFSFVSTSFSNGIQRFYNFELGKSGVQGVNKVFNFALFIQICIGLVLIVPTYILGEWYLNNKMVIPLERFNAASYVFKLSLLTFLFQVLQVPFSASVIAHEHMGFYSIISVVNAVLMLIITIILPYLNYDELVLYSILLTFLSLLFLLVNICYSKKKFPEIYLSRVRDKSLLQDMCIFSGWNMLGTLGLVLKDQGTNLILNYYFGPVVNAARAIAIQVNGGLQSFVANVAIPVRPQVIQSYSKGNVSRSLSLTYTISKMSCFFLFILSLPIILEIDYVLYLWLGDGYPNFTSVFVVLTIVNAYLHNLNSSTSGLVHASGKMKIYQISGIIVSVLSLFFIYIGISQMRLAIIAFMILIIMDIFRQVIALCVLKKIVMEFSFKVYIHQVLKPLLKVVFIGSLVPITLHSIMDYGFLRFVIVVLFSFLSSLYVIYFYGLNINERKKIKEFAFRYFSILIHR